MLLVLNALVHALHLRKRKLRVELLEATDDAPHLARNLVLWADRAIAEEASQPIDVCVRMQPDPGCADIQDLFSCLLAVSGFRSLGLYWDSSSLADDLAVWGVAVPSQKSEDLASTEPKQVQDFLQSGRHAVLILPVAVARDTLTYVKRHAGASYVACLNLPEELQGLAKEVAEERPDVWFVDFGSPWQFAEWAANRQSVSSAGLSLHERIGLIRASDAYIGRLDVLGCAAVMSDVPAAILDTGERLGASAARTEVLKFLSLHFR